MDLTQTTLFPAEQLRGFCQRVFEHCGVPVEDAAEAARVLELADLRGIDSHGVARLASYFGLLKSGAINAQPQPRIIRESPSTATVDGDNGLGLIVGPWANRLALDKADAVGTGWVAVRNSHHYGIAGYYVIEALERQQIGWAMTNTSPIVAPLWGAERQLGTNPIAIAFPGETEPPIVIDLATSAVPFGKIEMAIRKGQTVPPGWGVDRDGEMTTDPRAISDGGALLPLGSTRELGGHKGFCLAAMVDILSGVLGGANWGPFTPAFTTSFGEPRGQVGIGLGHFFGAMKIEAFIDPAEFRQQIDQWIRNMRQTRPAPGSEAVLIPGDPERQAHEQRAKTGIPLVPKVVAELQEIAQQTGVPL